MQQPELQLKAVVISVNPEFYKPAQLSINSETGEEYQQEYQLTTCVITGINNPLDFPETLVAGFERVYLDQKQSAAKTIIGFKEHLAAIETGVEVRKTPVGVDDEVILYVRREVKPDGSGFKTFFQIGNEMGRSDAELEAAISAEAEVAAYFASMAGAAPAPAPTPAPKAAPKAAARRR